MQSDPKAAARTPNGPPRLALLLRPRLRNLQRAPDSHLRRIETILPSDGPSRTIHALHQRERCVPTQRRCRFPHRLRQLSRSYALWCVRHARNHRVIADFDVCCERRCHQGYYARFGIGAALWIDSHLHADDRIHNRSRRVRRLPFFPIRISHLVLRQAVRLQDFARRHASVYHQAEGCRRTMSSQKRISERIFYFLFICLTECIAIPCATFDALPSRIESNGPEIDSASLLHTFSTEMQTGLTRLLSVRVPVICSPMAGAAGGALAAAVSLGGGFGFIGAVRSEFFPAAAGELMDSTM